MSNVVEFVLKLKDMMSAGMSRVASTAQSAMARVDAATARTSRNSTRSISSLNDQLDKLRKTRDLSIDTRQIRAANREIDRVERQMERLENMGRNRSTGGGFGLGIRSLVAGAGLAAGLGAAITSGLQATSNQVSFDVMAGGAAGSKLYSDLTKFAQESIFGNEVLSNAQTMLAFGMNADRVMPTTKMLGDISMGNKERLGSLTLAYSQIQATGRLMGQDLLQLVNAGFNPLQIISEKTGQSMAALKEKMEKGAISAGMVQQAFEAATAPGGRFFDMTNRIAQTPFGMWEAFKGQIEGIAMQFGLKLMPSVKSVIEILPALADSVANLLTNYGVPFVGWLANSVLWIRENWGWLRYLAVAFVALRLAIGAYNVTVGLATSATRLLNLTLSVTPLGRIIALLTGVASLFGLLAATSSGVADSVKEITDAAQSAITAPQLQSTYAAAGEDAGKAFSYEAAAQIKGMTPRIAEAMQSPYWSMAARKVAAELPEPFLPAGKTAGEMFADGFRTYTQKEMERIADEIGKIKIRYAPDAFPEPPQKKIYGVPVEGFDMNYKPRFALDRKGGAAPTTGVPGMGGSPAFQMDASSLMKDKGDRMTGGGVRSITINLGKFFDNIILNGIRGSDEAAEAVADKTGEELLRMLRSTGAM